MALICPYCDIEITESAVEAEDGCCPECGAFINAGTTLFDNEDDFDGDESYEEEDEFDDLDDDLDDDEL